jgi:hypothetical protein
MMATYTVEIKSDDLPDDFFFEEAETVFNGINVWLDCFKTGNIWLCTNFEFEDDSKGHRKISLEEMTDQFLDDDYYDLDKLEEWRQCFLRCADKFQTAIDDHVLTFIEAEKENPQ